MSKTSSILAHLLLLFFSQRIHAHSHVPSKTLYRPTLGFDCMIEKNPYSIQMGGECGVHAGVNMVLPETRGMEVSLFLGIERTLRQPLIDPYGWFAMIGGEVSGTLYRNVRWALMSTFAWGWYDQLTQEEGWKYRSKDRFITVRWTPPITLTLQVGPEIVLYEWGKHKQSEVAFQVLGGVAPAWSSGQWEISGIFTGALHLNF